jgi:hypothetical protein
MLGAARIALASRYGHDRDAPFPPFQGRDVTIETQFLSGHI